jgi:hypothetical protein
MVSNNNLDIIASQTPLSFYAGMGGYFGNQLTPIYANSPKPPTLQ